MAGRVPWTGEGFPYWDGQPDADRVVVIQMLAEAINPKTQADYALLNQLIPKAWIERKIQRMHEKSRSGLGDSGL